MDSVFFIYLLGIPIFTTVMLFNVIPREFGLRYSFKPNHSFWSIFEPKM